MNLTLIFGQDAYFRQEKQREKWDFWFQTQILNWWNPAQNPNKNMFRYEIFPTIWWGMGEQKLNENLFQPKFPSIFPKAFLKPNPQSKSGQIWYFPHNFMGIWGSRSPMKTCLNPNSLRHCQRHFSSQNPNQSQVKLDIFPEILWVFGGAEAQWKLTQS